MFLLFEDWEDGFFKGSVGPGTQEKHPSWGWSLNFMSCGGSSLGHELRQMVQGRLPSKKGRACVSHYENSHLLLHQALQEQGIVSKTQNYCARLFLLICMLHVAACNRLPVPEGGLE